MFYQTPGAHLGKRTHGCPICNESKGEKEIRKFLIKNNINFINQKTFPGCVDTRNLLFDFYLPELNLCIEFNGIQHYKIINIFGGNNRFEEQLKKDKIKVGYCKNNNIQLLAIRYDENIESVLREYILIK